MPQPVPTDGVVGLNGKKAEYYTSATNYTDDDNNSKSFTFIDHSPKTKVGGTRTSEEELGEISAERKEWVENTIQSILAISASICPEPYQDFRIAGEGRDTFAWNEAMIRDEGLDVWKRVFLLNILENRLAEIRKTF